jgi:hypothetical protein
MRKPISIAIDEKVLEVIKNRAGKKHQSLSRTIEEILREKLRLG